MTALAIRPTTVHDEIPTDEQIAARAAIWSARLEQLTAEAAVLEVDERMTRRHQQREFDEQGLPRMVLPLSAM